MNFYFSVERHPQTFANNILNSALGARHATFRICMLKMLSVKILETLRKRKSVKSTSANREIRYDDRDICHTESTPPVSRIRRHEETGLRKCYRVRAFNCRVSLSSLRSCACDRVFAIEHSSQISQHIKTSWRLEGFRLH